MPRTAAKLVLASGSPQRKQLLAEAGYTFRVCVPSDFAECGVCSRETPGELVARLAFQKAVDVVEQLANSSQPLAEDETIVACDTLAECMGQILGKPRNEHHAREMLALLSGREHRVYSGLCLWSAGAAAPRLRVERTTLRMDRLDEAQIAEYLASRQWEGKAGAFGYQDRVGWLHIVSGSESNVVGLPLELLAEMLETTPPRAD